MRVMPASGAERKRASDTASMLTWRPSEKALQRGSKHTAVVLLVVQACWAHVMAVLYIALGGTNADTGKVHCTMIDRELAPRADCRFFKAHIMNPVLELLSDGVVSVRLRALSLVPSIKRVTLVRHTVIMLRGRAQHSRPFHAMEQLTFLRHQQRDKHISNNPSPILCQLERISLQSCMLGPLHVQSLPEDAQLLEQLGAALAALCADADPEVSLEARRALEEFAADSERSPRARDEDRRREEEEADMPFLPEELERQAPPAKPCRVRPCYSTSIFRLVKHHCCGVQLERIYKKHSA